jgi:hypothetical protein
VSNHERPHNLQGYFGLFRGEPHTLSEIGDAKPAVEILIKEGNLMEQLALDGNSLIIPVKKNGGVCQVNSRTPENTIQTETNFRE